MNALIPTVKRLLFGELSPHKSLVDYYEKIQRERPSTATGLPPSTKVQVVERTVTVGHLPGLEEKPTKQPVDDSPLGPPGPTISSVGPGTIATVGGDWITINGDNFLKGPNGELPTIEIGGNIIPTGDTGWVSNTQLTGRSPAHGVGLVDVKVTIFTGELDTLYQKILYQIRPIVSAVSPNAGPVGVGTAIVVTGSGFAPDGVGLAQGRTGVFLGNVRCGNETVISDSEVHAITPPGNAGTYSVSVINRFSLQGTLANAYTFGGTPTGGGGGSGTLSTPVFRGDKRNMLINTNWPFSLTSNDTGPFKLGFSGASYTVFASGGAIVSSGSPSISISPSTAIPPPGGFNVVVGAPIPPFGGTTICSVDFVLLDANGHVVATYGDSFNQPYRYHMDPMYP